MSEATESVESVEPTEVGVEESAEVVESTEGVPSDGVEVQSEEESSEEPETTEESSDEPEKLYEVKVDGESFQVTLDEMMKSFQLGSSAHKKFQEAAQLRKEAKVLQDQLVVNPIEAAIKAGASPQALRELMESYLYEQIKYDEMSPEEKELQELRKFKESQEQERVEREKQSRQAQIEQETQYHAEQLQAEYTAALEKSSVPATENAISRIAQIQLDAANAGYDIPVEQAVGAYVKEQQSLVNSYIKQLNEDQIESIIGKEKLDALRKKELAKLKNPTPSPTNPVTERTQHEKEKQSALDFFSSLRG